MVVLQLSGGNDYMNTVVPYNDPLYRDYRPTVNVREDEVLTLDDDIGLHPTMGPIRDMYKDGNVAIIHGVGYENSPRSHFRSMDIWHTCEPEIIATEGWLAKVIKQFDPNSENPLTGVSFGRGLPRAMAAPGVVATSVDDLDNYGLLTSVEADQRRAEDLAIFKRMYTPAVGSGLVMDYFGDTGQSVLSGADLIKVAPQQYTSTVEYANNPIAKSLRDVARVHTAGLGTRIFYTQHGGYDHHAQEVPTHARLLAELTGAISDFWQDLREHDAADNVSMLVFTEFGRRIKDNGSGTDHGSGGGAFIIGDNIDGGLYAEYPSLERADWERDEDLAHTFDFRGVYGTMLEQHLKVDPEPIVGGVYEQLHPYKETASA
ncbi:MAG TPA: hypothetical protein DGB32_06075 [Dehalococcoidia bacterium]|nr:hypothetical protein [Dehalococcoidia bacterium]